MLLKQTHTGSFADIEPTGRQLSFEIYEFVRIESGKIAEGWVASRPSIAEMIQQLRSAAAP